MINNRKKLELVSKHLLKSHYHMVYKVTNTYKYVCKHIHLKLVVYYVKHWLRYTLLLVILLYIAIGIFVLSWRSKYISKYKPSRRSFLNMKSFTYKKLTKICLKYTNYMARWMMMSYLPSQIPKIFDICFKVVVDPKVNIHPLNRFLIGIKK